MCQSFITAALTPTKKPEVLIYHYMDDTLLAGPPKNTLETCLQFLMQSITSVSLLFALEKIQRSTPWKYLERKFLQSYVIPQRIKFIFLNRLLVHYNNP